jgi:hypothetical protein
MQNKFNTNTYTMQQKLFKVFATAIFSLAFLFSFFNVVNAATISKPANNLGLVGYWSFNEATSTQAGDFSGRGNAGTLISGPTWTTGKQGGSITFDGVDDYVQLDGTNLSFPNQTFTVSFWYKNTSANSGWLIANAVVGGGWGISNSGYVFLKNAANNQSRFVPAVSIADGTWKYITYVITTNTTTAAAQSVTMYVNGVAAGGAFDGVTTYNPSTFLYFGARGNGVPSDFSNGSIDEVRIYNRGLTATEITNLYRSGASQYQSSAQSANYSNSGLVGYWSLNGNDTVWSSASTGVTYDRSGNNNTGTLINMNRSTTPAAGKLGQALNFDGTNDVVNVGDPASGALDFGTGNFSVSAWIYRNSNGSVNLRVLSKGAQNDNSGSAGYAFFGSDNVLAFIVNPGGPRTVIQATTTGTSNWYHATGVVDRAGNQSLYINGVLMSTTTAPAGSVSSVNSFNIGRSSDGLLNWDGKIDEVRTYNRALSATEIKNLYNSGAVKYQSGAQSQSLLNSGLVGYWSMNGNDTLWSSATTGTSTDRSGQGNNGTLTNMSRSTTPTTGKIGQALNFDGTDDYVNAGNTVGNFAAGESFSVGFWFKSTDAANINGNNFPGFVAKASGAPVFGWGFSLSSNLDSRLSKLYFYTYSNDVSTNSFAPTLLNDGAWHHVVGVRNINTNSQPLYIDGVLVANNTLNSTGSVSSATNLLIGCRAVALAGCINSNIDEVRIYNRALSADEVKLLYNQGR